MATVYKILGQVNPSAATLSTLYTVPAANSAVVSTLNICNLGTTGAVFRVACRPAGASIANSQYIVYDTALPASDTISLTLGVTLGNTDVISVLANTASVTFTAFGSEIY
jgi:hypothetical protein